MAPERLTLLRTAHGLTKRALADAVGVTPAYITQVEKGIKPGSQKFLDRLAAYFHIEVQILFQRPRRRCDDECQHCPYTAPLLALGLTWWCL